MASKSAELTADGSKALSWREKRIMNAKPAVDLVLSSVSEIVKRSTNDSFRRACFDLMKVDNRLDFEVALRHHMIKMVKMRHGLDLESDNDTDKTIADQSAACTSVSVMNNPKDNSRKKVKVEREKLNITEVIEISDDDDIEHDDNDDDDLRFF